jgi:hypothetical protein
VMFILRGLIVGVAFFGVCYCPLCLLVVVFWHAARFFRFDSIFKSSASLFTLRIFPFAAAAFITLFFAMPAFFLLEGGMDEDLGTLLFSLGALLLLAIGSFRVAAGQYRASHLITEWLAESNVLNLSTPAPTFCAKRSFPPLLLYGIRAPKILVSEEAVSLLTPEELAVSIRHEVSHLRSRDNLKKLLVHGIPFPGMGSLERTWQERTELAADEAAVSSSEDGLNLATALVKLCNLARTQEPPAFVAAGLLEPTVLVDLRVRRLLAWKGAIIQSRKVLRIWLPLLFPAVAYSIYIYGHTLVLTHQFTEWLIH